MRVREWLEKNIWPISIAILFMFCAVITYNICQVMYCEIMHEKAIREDSYRAK